MLLLMFSVSILSQPLKADVPTDVTELGMVTDVNPLQPLKADVPIVVTEFPIVMDVKPIQPLNA